MFNEEERSELVRLCLWRSGELQAHLRVLDSLDDAGPVMLEFQRQLVVLQGIFDKLEVRNVEETNEDESATES